MSRTKLPVPMTLYRASISSYDPEGAFCGAEKLRMERVEVTHQSGSNLMSLIPVRREIFISSVAHLRQVENGCPSPHSGSLWGRTEREAIALLKKNIKAAHVREVEQQRENIKVANRRIDGSKAGIKKDLAIICAFEKSKKEKAG